jgi:cytochrome c-type biogenesis protein CcmH
VTGFVTVAVLLIALALAWVLPPLLRARRGAGGVEREASNLELLRDQLAELDADLKSGTLSSGHYAKARAELERRVLDETVAEQAAAGGGAGRGHLAAVSLAVVIPLSAVLMYLAIGSPDALQPQRAAAEGHSGLTKEQFEDMVGRLEQRLQKEPGNAEGWVLLARSNLMLQRFPEAAKAYARAAALVTDNADLYADYADALAMAQGQQLQGEPERLIALALKLDPQHIKALALAGTVAFEKKDYAGAIAYWERILKVPSADPEMVQAITGSIAEARSLAGGAPLAKATPPAPPAGKPAATPPSAEVSGTVRLAPELAGKAAPTDTVFIFARPVSGPRMPLAVLRKQVRDLPVTFRLDDSMAMSPASKLSDHGQVVIGARVSKGGGPGAQPGDLEGLSAPVGLGSSGIAVVINSEVR